MFSRTEALSIVREHVKNEALIRHMLSVEAAMRAYAEMFGEDLDTWGIAGLLHDFDWEIHPNLEQHPKDGAKILKERNVPDLIIRAILSHANHTGIARDSMMQKALYACDEITGLITATALVRPSKSIHDVKIKSIKKKWKDKSFAAALNRDEISEAVNEFDIELWEHCGTVLAAMQSIAPDLGLEGIQN